MPRKFTTETIATLGIDIGKNVFPAMMSPWLQAGGARHRRR